MFADAIAGGDAPPVAAMRAAGGIFHARTNVPDLGSAGITGGRRYPPTRNPYNPEYNSLGSSGGAAAALARGLATLAEQFHLEHLLLRSCQVTDAGVPHLAKMKSLKRLYLAGTDVTVKGIETLKAALPECRIETPEGLRQEES